MFHSSAASERIAPHSQSSADRSRFEAEIQKIEQLLPKIPDRGAALYLLSRRYAQIGNLQKALALLKECISLDEGFDPSESHAFDRLHDNAEFRNLAERARSLSRPVHRAHLAFKLQEKDLFPEGLAADEEKKMFYMGSAYHRKIVQFDRKGRVRDFVSPHDYRLLPVNGVRVDSEDHSVWAATAADDLSEAAVVHFDIHGKLLGRFAVPGPLPHDSNDLAVYKSRYVFVTDTSANQAYRLDLTTGRFEPIALPRPLFYPNGITFSNDGKQLYIADSFGLICLDLRNNKAEEVNPGPGNTLSGIDGLYWYQDGLVGVQYGTGSYRIMRWHLSADGRHVTSSHVLESQSSLTKFPTTGAIMGAEFYFIANAGFDNLAEGKILDRQKLEDVQIAVLSLN